MIKHKKVFEIECEKMVFQFEEFKVHDGEITFLKPVIHEISIK